MAPIMFDEVDVSAITLGVTKTLKSGIKFIYIEHKGRKLSIQTPTMVIPWTCVIREKPNDSPGVDCKLSLSFKGRNVDDPDCELTQFYNKITEIDAHVKQLIFDSKAYPKVTDIATLDVIFKDTIKEKDNNYDPTFPVKVYTSEIPGMQDEQDVTLKYTMDLEVFDLDENRTDVTKLSIGNEASIIADLSYVWLSSSMFGLTYATKKVLVIPVEDVKEFPFKMSKKHQNKRKSDSDEQEQAQKMQRAENEDADESLDMEDV